MKKSIFYLFILAMLAFSCQSVEQDQNNQNAEQGLKEAEFTPINFAEINVRPRTGCDVVYLVEDNVSMVYDIKVERIQTGATCNCTVKDPIKIPQPLSLEFIVPDKGYTKDELLDKVPSPWPGWKIKFSNPTIKLVRVIKPCDNRPIEQAPDLDKPIGG